MPINQTPTNDHSILLANNLTITKYAKRLSDDLKHAISVLSQLEASLNNDNQMAIDELIITHRSCSFLVIGGLRWLKQLLEQQETTSDQDDNIINEINLLNSNYADATGRIGLLFAARSRSLEKLIKNHSTIKTSPPRSHNIYEAKIVDILR